MPPHLVPDEPLSQVVFVHDYVQLVFRGATFSIYNALHLISDQEEQVQGHPGFSDALVRLIGQRVKRVSVATDHVLELKFESGTLLRVLHDESSTHGAEAFQFIAHDGTIVVEPNP